MARTAQPLQRLGDGSHGLALPQVEQRELRYFVAVAEELHFTRAAARLDISQPPLSATISRLEAKLGTQLFVRDSRNVALTPAGAELMTHARRILTKIDEAIDAVRHADRESTATLRVATTAGRRLSVLPGFERLLDVVDPHLAFDVETVAPAAIVPSVRSGTVDFGVLVGDAWHPGLGMRLLRGVLPVAVLHHAHALARTRRPLTRADLRAYPLAIWPEDDAPDGDWTAQLTAGAVCVVPSDAPLAGELVSRPLTGTTVTFQTWVVWNDDVPPPFLDEVREAALRFRLADSQQITPGE
jgi:DNA-binding transcriptional LysR family regulator